MSERKIEITLTQQVDEASVNRSNQQLEEAAKNTAASITATEQAEAQKRIAIAEEEAAAKARAMGQNAASGAAYDDGGGDGSDAVRMRVRYLENLSETLSKYQERSRSWVAALDKERAALENQTEGLSAAKESLEDFDSGIEDLAARQVALSQEMNRTASDAEALAQDLVNGKVSLEDAAHAASVLRQSHKTAAQGMRDMSADAKRLHSDIQAVAEASRNAAASTVTAGAGAEVKLSALGKSLAYLRGLAKSTGSSMARGFRAAATAAGKLRVAINKINFTLALINQAWELLGKIWDWMHGKSEAATKAAEEHAEAMERLEDRAEEVHRREMSHIREQKAQDIYKHMEDGLKRINRELSKGVQMRQRDLNLMLRQKKMSMDEQEWKLKEEELLIDDALDSGEINNVEAAKRRAALDEKRKRLDYDREYADRDAKRGSVNYDLERTRAGIDSVKKDIERLAALKSSGITWYSAEQMASKKERYQADAMDYEERWEYEEYRRKVRRTLESLGMGAMFDAFDFGEFNMREKLGEMELKFREQLDTLQEREAEKNEELNNLIQEEKEAALHLEKEIASLRTQSNIRLRKTERKMQKDEVKKESNRTGEEAQDTARQAQERSRALKQENHHLIDQRAARRKEGNQPGEDNIKKLYDEVEKSGDAAMVRRIVAELRADGRQGKWSGQQARNYGQGIKDMYHLKGDDRQWWLERFDSLGKSQKLESSSKQLEAAADKLKDVADGAADNVGNVSKQAQRLADAYEKQLKATMAMETELENMLKRVTQLENQARYAKKK